jgi:hypothetical protein
MYNNSRVSFISSNVSFIKKEAFRKCNGLSEKNPLKHEAPSGKAITPIQLTREKSIRETHDQRYTNRKKMKVESDISQLRRWLITLIDMPNDLGDKRVGETQQIKCHDVLSSKSSSFRI